MNANVLMLYPQEGLPPDSTIRHKNQAAVRQLAMLMNGHVFEHGERVPAGTMVMGYPLEVVATTTDLPKSILEPGGLYGAIVESDNHGHKAVLHALPHGDAPSPDWYSNSAASASGEGTMPGFSFFDHHSGLHAFDRVVADHGQARLKIANEQAGRGQWVVDDKDHLKRILSSNPNGFASGFVMEPHLHDHEVMVVSQVQTPLGFISLAGHCYDVIDSNGKAKYGGAELTAINQPLEDLATHFGGNRLLREAIRAATETNRVFEVLGATVSKFTFDVVSGNDSKGNHTLGVTDTSLRPTASTPAEIAAMKYYATHTGGPVSISLRYDYTGLPVAQGFDTFLNTGKVTIGTRVSPI
ncbi:DUF3182 family protein [Candidatus Saccharibacteria bacterium]|nr:DUF3182 family protein [Candidatus Saccharibacteria bacterium]